MTDRTVKMWEVGVTTINTSLDKDKYHDRRVNEGVRFSGDEIRDESHAIEKAKERYPLGEWELLRIRYVKKTFVSPD